MYIPIWAVIAFASMFFAVIVMGVTAEINKADLEQENAELWYTLYNKSDNEE